MLSGRTPTSAKRAYLPLCQESLCQQDAGKDGMATNHPRPKRNMSACGALEVILFVWVCRRRRTAAIVVLEARKFVEEHLKFGMLLGHQRNR